MTTNGSWRLWLVAAVALVLSSLCMAQTPDDEDKSALWFSADSLNAGLGEAPDVVKRSTPREAIRSFLELTKQEDFGAAAHILNLSELEPAEQRKRGGTLARQLAEVLRRGEWLEVSSLPGRQDAATEHPADKRPHAGKPRRNIKLASLTAQGETHDIRLGRYRVGEQEPVWLVMPDSVASVPLLYEKYGPSFLESYLPKPLKTAFGPLKLWEWIAIPLVLVAVGLTGWWIYRLVGLIKRFLPSGAVSIFASQIRMPMALIVMSLVTQALLDYVVSFSAVVTTTFRVLLIAIMAWGAGTIAIRLVDTLMLRMTRRLMGTIDDTKHKDDRKLLTTLYALRRLIILVTVTAVTVYVLSQIRLFETLGMSLLASASVLTVLVGIAGQAVLGNILSSFQLSLAKSIRIGDLVMFEGQWCHVEGIFYTFIRLRSWNERRVIVPVTYFVSKPFENLSVKNAKEYRSLVLTVHLSADIPCLRERFMEYAQEEESVIEHHKLCCYVTGQTGMAQTFSCYLMTSDPFAGWVAEMNIRERLMSFIREQHPEWWPREGMVVSREDVARGEARTEPDDRHR